MPFLPPIDPGIEVSVATRGISKGISQTDGVQIVGRGELALGSVYLAALGKNLDSPNTEGELQFSTGGRFKIAKADVAVSIAYKKWLDTSGHPDDEAAELVISASRGFGSLTPRAQLTYSPDDLGTTTHSVYAEAGLAWKAASKLTVSANLGRRSRGKGLEYTAANVGVAYALTRNFNAELRLFDTNKSNVDEPYRQRVVALLRAKF